MMSFADYADDTNFPSPNTKELAPVRAQAIPEALRSLGQGDEGLDEAVSTALFRTLLRGIKEIQRNPTRGSLTLAYHLLRLSSVSIINKNEEAFSTGVGGEGENSALSGVGMGSSPYVQKSRRVMDSCIASLEAAMGEIKDVAHRIEAPPIDPAGSLLGGDFETAGSYALKQFAPLIGMLEQILVLRKQQDQDRQERSEIYSMLDLFRTAKEMGLTLPEDTQARLEAILASRLNTEQP
jgi:hypothetical protein